MLRSKGRPPAALSSLALKVIEQVELRFGQSHCDRLTTAVADLSRLFTKDRGSLAARYLDDPAHAAAYLTYFMPVNLSKVQVLLDELPPDTIVKEDEAGLRVLDLGSGPGTGALAVLDWLDQRNHQAVRRLSVLVVDSSSEALHQAGELWNCYCNEAGISGARLIQCRGNLMGSEKEPWRDRANEQVPFDLIILANCLNELYLDATDPITARTELIVELLQMLAPHGTLMILEPALRETSRSLHHVRDRLLQEKRCTVYSPCLHELSCPALIHSDDWCHEERPWKAPIHIQNIDGEVGFMKDALKFSYLLLRKDGRTIVHRDPHVFRIVSELRELKGDTRAWICNELGRSEIGRLDRAESETNAAWSECQRGTIVRIEGLKRRDGSRLARIPDDAFVRIIRSV